MRTGKLADLVCNAGWNLLYTVETGEHGTVTVALSSDDGSAVETQVRHVKQGNAGGIPHSSLHSIISPHVLTNDSLQIKELGVGSLDDILVFADVADILVASVNTQGIEHTHGRQ